MGSQMQLACENAQIVVLVAGGSLAWSVVNGLVQRLGPVTVIEEPSETKGEIIRRRLRLVGPVATAGQIAFGLLRRITAKFSKDRIEEIRLRHGLNPYRPDGIAVHRVPSLNSEEARALLRRLAPKAIAVYGTRVLSRQTLAAVDAPFINYHAGINPKYRGQHPAYWALAADDTELAGVTVHLVDAGVDTGDVLYQERVAFAPCDNITTYQTLQAVTGIPLFARALEDALAGRLQGHVVNLPSRTYLPPTIWRYLWNGFSKCVW